jgi:BRCT domain type II-containing protein
VSDNQGSITRMGFEMEYNLSEIVRIARETAIEECAQIAASRATRLRAKAKAQTSPSKQSYFAQSIEARVIADSILGLLHPVGPSVDRGSK